jgi:Fe-S-cluster containining protein
MDIEPFRDDQLWLRTTWARRGVLASFGRIDAGFDGTLTFGAFNTSADRLEVPIGETFAQVVVESMSGSAEADYSERSGHYQHQRGVTVAVERDDDDSDEVQEWDDGHRGPRVVPAPCIDRDCHECCLDTEMPLSRRDVERLEGRGHVPAGFTMIEDGFTFLANVDGHCFFLDADGRCTEYGNRPEGCRLYPLVLDAEMTEFDMDHLCPHAGSVKAGSTDETALLELLDRIARDRVPD